MDPVKPTLGSPHGGRDCFRPLTFVPLMKKLPQGLNWQALARDLRMEGRNHAPGLCRCALGVCRFLENVSQLLSLLPVFATSTAVAPPAVAELGKLSRARLGLADC